MKRVYVILVLFLFCMTGQAFAGRIIFDDFETGTLGSVFNVNVSPANTIQSTVVHSGTKALKYSPQQDTSGNLSASMPNNGTVYFKFWWWIPSTIGSGSGHHMWRLGASGSNNQFQNGQLDTGSDGAGLWFIDILGSVDSGFTYHTGQRLPTNQWFQFECLSILNTPGSSNGILKVWVNGTLQYNVSNAVYRTSAVNYNVFALTTNFGSAAGDYWYIDDVEVWDTDQSGGSGTTAPSNPSGLKITN